MNEVVKHYKKMVLGDEFNKTVYFPESDREKYEKDGYKVHSSESVVD